MEVAEPACAYGGLPGSPQNSGQADDHAHFAGSPGLVGVYSGYMYLHYSLSSPTFTRRLAQSHMAPPHWRAGAYDHQKFIALSRKDFTDSFIPLALELGLGIQGEIVPVSTGVGSLLINVNPIIVPP